MKDRFHRPLLLASVLSVVLGLAAPVAAQPRKKASKAGSTSAPLFGSLSDATFRGPGGGDAIHRLRVERGARPSSPDMTLGRVPLARGCASASSRQVPKVFATPEMAGSTNMMVHTDPRYSMFITDPVLHWAPARSSLSSASTGSWASGPACGSSRCPNPTCGAASSPRPNPSTAMGSARGSRRSSTSASSPSSASFPGQISDLEHFYSRGGYNYYEVTGTRTDRVRGASSSRGRGLCVQPPALTWVGHAPGWSPQASACVSRSERHQPK